MGLCSSNPGTAQERAKDAQVTKNLAKSQEVDRDTVKILLLGAGECGKSTILKQMRILHRKDFKDDERKHYREIIYRNVVESIQSLARACFDLHIPFALPGSQVKAEEMLKVGASDDPIPYKDMIKELLQDSAIATAMTRSSEFYLLDSASYWFANLDKILKPGFVPTDQDIIRSRQATTGIVETDLEFEGGKCKMYDVGGQRGERKKWIHCFEDVRAILFIASLSEYDQVLAEDSTRNRLVESLALFEGIIGLPWFKETSIILFLNKNDIFTEKIKRTDLGIYFSNYIGGRDHELALRFVTDMFLSKNANPKKTIYAHVTDATDTNLIAYVWRDTKAIILDHNLQRAGLV